MCQQASNCDCNKTNCLAKQSLMYCHTLDQLNLLVGWLENDGEGSGKTDIYSMSAQFAVFFVSMMQNVRMSHLADNELSCDAYILKFYDTRPWCCNHVLLLLLRIATLSSSPSNRTLFCCRRRKVSPICDKIALE